MAKTPNKTSIPKVIITATNLRVLDFVAKYQFVSRRMIQLVLFPHCKSHKAVTTRLRKLRLNGYVARAKMNLVLDGQNPIPIYHLTKKGAKALANGYSNPEYLNCNIKSPASHLLYHWLGIVETHILVDNAIAADGLVEMIDFYSEWETINKAQPNPALHFSLHTRLQDSPPLSVAPDFGFIVESKGFQKVFYGEYDRGPDSVRRIQRKKPPGYFFLHQHQLHKKHFPSCQDNNFLILMITTTEYRRDELARKISMRDGAPLWRFAIKSDLSSESFFRLPVWKNCDNEFCSLIKR